MSSRSGPSLSDFKDFAKWTFSNTTGSSGNIDMAHQSLHGDLSKVPLTRSSVNRLVNTENFHAVNGPGSSAQDWLAYAFTPMRRMVAHSAARAMTPIDAQTDYGHAKRAYQAAKPPGDF